MADNDKLDWQLTGSYRGRIVRVGFKRRAVVDDEMLQVVMMQRLAYDRSHGGMVKTPMNTYTRAVASNGAAIYALALSLLDAVFEREGELPDLQGDFDETAIY